MKSQRPAGKADDLNRTMWQLCSDRNCEGIQARLATGEWDPNRPLVMELQPGGLLLLSAAASGGWLALAEQLIALGADVNAHMPREAAPLLVACESGNAEMVDLLLKAGADANAKATSSDEGDPGETPLMAAAAQGFRDVVQKLLNHGADVRAVTRRGRTALTFSLLRESIDRGLVRLLLEAGCPVDGRDLHHPVYQRDLDVVEALLATGPDVNMRFDWPASTLSNERGDTPLFVAVARNSAEMLELESRIKSSERLAIIDLLIEAGADVNSQRGMKGDGWTPLMLAAAQDEDEILRRLIQAGADPDKTVETRWLSLVDGNYRQCKGPLSAVGMARQRPENKKARRLLLGHE